jgi:hypothetical protein
VGLALTGSDGFMTVYDAVGKRAGTYTRPDAIGTAWTSRDFAPAPAAAAVPVPASAAAPGVSVAYLNVNCPVTGASYDIGSMYLNAWYYRPSIMTVVNADGTVSVCATDNLFTYVYEYTAALQYVKTMRVTNEFPELGAFTKDSAGNYYFFYAMDIEGNNEAAGRNIENMALVKYNSSGVKTNTFRLKAYPENSFYGVRNPFDAGTCRVEVSGSMIAVYFGRQMFGGHQASYGFVLNKDSFARLDRGNGGMVSTTGTMAMPYVSHSFNQFILPVDNGFVFADHGDAKPRAFTFARFQNNAASKTGVTAFRFKGGGPGDPHPNGLPGHTPGDITYNVTFAQMGGMARTPNGYIVAGAYENKTIPVPRQHNESRNLFIMTIDEALNTVSAPKYLTDYTDKDTQNAANPKIVRLGDSANRYLLLWEQRGAWRFTSANIPPTSTHALVIDANGNPVGQIKDLPNIHLSHNDVLRYNPTNGRVYWAIVDPANEGRIAVYSYAP